MKKIIFYLVFAVSLYAQTLQANNQQLLQLIDYLGADYAGAVESGEVINEAEYKEMLDFSAGIHQQLTALADSDVKAELLVHSEKLVQRVKDKKPEQEIKSLTDTLQRTIINAYDITVTPQSQPDFKQAALLYKQQCASCHGMTGEGNGPAALGMDPPPINFHDIDRYQQRTVHGLFNTITQGVAGTGMLAFAELTDKQRWSLAFYVGSLAAKNDIKPKDVNDHPLADIATLTTLTPAQAKAQYGEEGEQVMAFLRAHPDALFTDKTAPIEFTKQKLHEALIAYKKQDNTMAYQLAVSAYLDGYELIEKNIGAMDKQLMFDVETAMTDLRHKIRSTATIDAVDKKITAINQKLDATSSLLTSKSLSKEATFGAAFFILLREGLEALLIVAALAAFLVKTKRRDGLRYIHFGWISALVAGLLTWWGSVSLFSISGASREVTEGIAAIVATIVLLYVGFWMHDKTSAAKWKRFIDDNMQKALSSGTLWTLSGLSFIAVYREAFETILFYQALWVQTGSAGQNMVLSGFITAAVVLMAVAWLVMRYSVRLPLRQFFAVTGWLMFILAIIFAGKGIAALQEAGVLAAYPVNFFRVDILGIYPNLQGLLVQFILIVLAIFLLTKKVN